MSDFRRLIENIFDIEEHDDMFQRRAFGVYYWSVLRNAVAGDAARAAGLFTQERVDGESADRRKLPRILLTGFSAFMGYLCRRHTLKYCKGPAILSHRVKKHVNATYADRFTLEMLACSKSLTPVVLDQADTSLARFSKIPGQEIVPIEWVYLVGKVFGYSVGWMFALHPEMRRLDRCLDALGVRRKRRRYHRKLAKFFCEQRIFATLLRKSCLEELVLTVSYGERSIIAAASLAGIAVREYQHNPISRWSLGYSMPNGGRMPYSPDTLMLYGEAWQKSAPYPLGMNLEIVHEHEEVDNGWIFSGQRDPEAVVFLSQPEVATEIVKFARYFAESCSNCRVYYRPHPLDNCSNEIFEEFWACNLQVDQAESLDQILNTCTYQVGAFSTALIRGLQLGCRTIVLDIPGSEHLDWIVEQGDAIRVSEPEELTTRWREAPVAAVPSRYRAPVR